MLPDLKRIQRLAEFELSQFEMMLETAVGIDLRSVQFIEWIAVFVPEALDRNFQESLGSFIKRARTRPEFPKELWPHMLPLDCAMFALTGNFDYLDLLTANWDHDNSGIRRNVHSAAALIADRLYFNDHNLQARTRNNLASHHLFNSYALLVLAVSRGSKADKIARLREWESSVAPANNDPRLIDELARDRSICNTLLTYIVNAQSYSMLRLACRDSRFALTDAELSVGNPGPAYDQAELHFPEAAREMEANLFERVLERLDAHPLMQSMVRLTDHQPPR